MKQFIVILTYLSFTLSITAQINQTRKLLPDDGDEKDWFGNSVSISGDYAIVSANRDEVNGEYSGSAYIFYGNDDTWVQQAKLLPDDGNEGDNFGQSVAISGNYAIIGANGEDDNGENSGSAYIFHRQDTVWTQQAKLLGNDGSNSFGSSVSISGDYAIIGASGDNTIGDKSGSAYLFHRQGTVWTQLVKLFPDDGDERHNFGSSVAISGEYAIVGASETQTNGESSGSAYIFHCQDTVWTQQAKLLPDNVSMGFRFGENVAISGNQAVIGASGDDANEAGNGSVSLFQKTRGNWVLQAKLLPGEINSLAKFGNSIAVSDKNVIIGAFQSNNSGKQSGSAYIFLIKP